MIFHCKSMDDEVNIEKVEISKNLDFMNPYEWHYHVLDHAPEFSQLSPELQQGFVEFLYEQGIHPHLALIVSYLSMNKEQRLFMGWLKEVSKIQ